MKTVRMLVGLLALGLVFGATALAAPEPHPEKGPHGGPLAEWGEEEYHLEIVPDAKNGAVAVYVLDGEVKKAKPIDAKELILTVKATPAVTLKLTAVAEKGDPEGKFSKYVGKHDIFTKEMKWAGSVSGKVGTKPYAGDFKQK